MTLKAIKHELIDHPDASAVAELVVSTSNENERYLSDAQFAQAIQETRCTASSISLSFNDTKSFEIAQSQWQWINQPGNQLYLFLDQPGCGEDEARQPYNVTGVTFANNTAHLQAFESQWTDVAGTYQLRYGAPPSRSDPEPRGFGDIDEDLGTVSLDFDHDISGTIISEDDLSLDLDCNPCRTFGAVNLHFEFRATNLGFSDQTAVLSVTTPEQLGANITLNLAADKALTNVVQGTYPIYQLDLPHLASIPGVFEVGPVLRVQAYADVSKITASANLTTGVDVTIDSSSHVDFDLFHPDSYSTGGWMPSFAVQTPSASDNVSVSANVGTEIILDLEASVFSVGLMAGLALVAPEISADLSFATDAAGGICNTDDGTAGLSFDLGVGAELDVFAGLNADSSFDTASLPNKKELFSTSTQLYYTCLAFASSTPSATAYSSGTIHSSATSYSSAIGSLNGTVYSSIIAYSSATPYSSAPASPSVTVSSNAKTYVGTMNR